MKKDRTEWVVLICTALGLFFLPSRTKDFVIRTQGTALVIQMSKTSPPRLAFHETVDRVLTEVPDPQEANLVQVNLNEVVAASGALRGPASIQPRKMVLDPMQVSRVEIPEMKIDSHQWADELPQKQKDRLQLANQRSQVLDRDWKVPTWPEVFEEKLKEAKSRAEALTKVNVAKLPAAGPHIYIAAKSENGTWRTPEVIHENVGVEAGPAVSGLSESENGQHLVTGTLAVTAEAMLGPGRHLEVRWFEDGVAKEAGQVNLDPKNVSYSISVPSLSGRVVARVLDETGSEVGTGHFRLSQMTTSEQLSHASITVQAPGITRYAQNFYDQDANRSMTALTKSRRNPNPEILVSAYGESVKTDEDGRLKTDGLADGSWTLLRTQKKGFYPSLHLASTGAERALPLFPAKMMQALLQIIRETRGPISGGETGSVVWGQMTARGQGAAGLSVEIEDAPDARPIYFSDLLIPDDKATATSRNGYFAFVDLPRGFYSIRATQGKKQVGFANVEVDEQTVSPLQIATDSLSEKVPVKVYDAFEGSPQMARVEFQHLGEAIDLQGYAPIEVPQDEAISLVQVTPNSADYLPSVYPFASESDHLHLPLIRQDWLMSLKAASKISDAPDSGVIIGFVPGDAYEVDLPHVAAADARRLHRIYFDPQGNPSSTGVPGGGFIIFNAPAGSHTVSVLPKSSAVLHSRVIPVDPGTFNVLKFDF